MNYVGEVADLFLARCRRVSILGPADFAIIAEWEKEEIPLAIILNSINRFWDETSEAGPSVESICQIQDKVNDDYMNWLSSRVI